MKRHEHEKISAEKAREILLKSGLDVSVEEAQKILEFLRTLATIVVSQYLENTD